MRKHHMFTVGFVSLALVVGGYASANLSEAESDRLLVYRAEKVEEPMEPRLVEGVLRAMRSRMEQEGRTEAEIQESLDVIRRTATQPRTTISEVRALILSTEQSLSVRSATQQRLLGGQPLDGGQRSSYGEIITPSVVGLLMGSSAPFQFDEGRIWDRGAGESQEGTENLSHTLGTPLGPWIVSGQHPGFLPFELSARDQVAAMRDGENQVFTHQGTRYRLYANQGAIDRADVLNAADDVILTIRFSDFREVQGKPVAHGVVLRRFQSGNLASEYRLTLRSVAVGNEIPETDRYLLPVGVEVADEREGGTGRFTSTGEIPER